MLTSETALALLQASLTGAGLVLAAYALIVPLSKRLFEERAITSIALMKEFRKKANQSDTELKDTEKLKTLIDRINATQNVPDYLKYGMGGTFLGYVACTLLSYAVVVDWQRPASDDWLSFIFVITTIIFLVVGLLAIKDVQKIMKRDLVNIRNSLNET